MTRGIYLSVKNDSEGFRLPVNPEEVEVVIKGDGEGFKIAKLGSINIPKDVELEEFPLESFFPAQDYHFLVAEFREPIFYIEKLKRWQKQKLPVRYIFVEGSFTINEMTTIESFTYKETFGSEDVPFKLSLKKYVPFGPKKMEIKKPKAVKGVTTNKPAVVKKNTPPRQNSKPQPQTYSLVKGDSLWKVAQKFLDNGNRFDEIAKLNGIKASDYRKLPIGLKLKLPAK
ncbi:LysM peptidoglycan-binding domain-containing protein [Psychrobacillus sp. FJAT-21963]|uniref:LysM peptidoglycan-binding domain-containing protein n=1 Tax=Psychrobacillus sp. FJAT-21963 TaxID=1712028 RepID=UPI0006F6A823|nr:LysM peptidoglycan-binding domain-containing protein [Psychrobacillus sp. FJAT-21963]KQL37123.1 peptidoglycan-binding protein [Psychrobacillus sp. FJAT-21963]